MKWTTQIRGWLKSTRLSWERWRYAFAPNDLLVGLRSLGVCSGDMIMVHSGMEGFAGLRGKMADVIDVLQQAVGSTGTLMMPTIPFTGTAIEYAESGQVFDVRRTPSRVGLLTELFRRSSGVVRSAHPTHSVAAWGNLSAAVVDGHSKAETPCGHGTPYLRMTEHGGKVVLLGVSIETFTFFHAIEAVLEPSMPFSPFTQKTYDFPCRDREGHDFVVKTRLFDPMISRRGLEACARIEAQRFLGTRQSGRAINHRDPRSRKPDGGQTTRRPKRVLL
jgi:aminoglycoside 3-N-acetyltransferase